MASITLNDATVLSLRFTLPPSGLSTATLEADLDEVPSGVVELSDGTTTYTMAVVRADVVSGVCRAELVGGRGGLVEPLEARSYNGLTARDVLTDILAAAGETLDATSTAAVVSRALGYWTRSAAACHEVLSTLVSALGARWRVLPSGNIWVGTESWPEASDELVLDELDRDGAAQSVYVAPDDLLLAPGVLLEQRRVGRVEYFMERDEGLRADYWIEAA